VDEWCSGWFHNILWTLSKFDKKLIQSPLKWVYICVTVGWVSEWVGEWVSNEVMEVLVPVHYRIRHCLLFFFTPLAMSDGAMELQVQSMSRIQWYAKWVSEWVSDDRKQDRSDHHLITKLF
jgi:hypothetical protein